MLSRDYIFRILQTFFDAVAKLFDGKRKTDEEFEKELNNLYEVYFEKSRSSFVNSLPEEIIDDLKKGPYFLEKSSMLAEVFYREYQLATEVEIKRNWAGKAMYLYDYINNHSSDYSLIYVSRIAELENELSAQ